jgi:hypothetical protein
VYALKVFELTIPPEYINIIHDEIKRPKRPGTELLELWLERELNLENPDTYGNLPTDESHITAQLLPNGNYKITMSDTCFKMIEHRVQPEPHSHRMSNDVIFHCWMDLMTNKVQLKIHITVKELI